MKVVSIRLLVAAGVIAAIVFLTPTFAQQKIVDISGIRSLSAISESKSVAGVLGINNGGYVGVHGVANSGQGIGVRGFSVATRQPAILGVSTGYYGGLFYNVTDLGSNAANANVIGLVGQSAYSNAGYMQQGEVGAQLARDNVYPAFYVTRVTAGLAGHDFTRPLVTVEDTTRASGGLMALIRNGVTHFEVSKDGYTNIAASGGTALTVTNPGLDDVKFRMMRSGGTASDWYTYLPGGSTDLRFFRGSDRLVLGGGSATQVAVKQASPPTCSFNCGTSPTVAGSDTAMIVTMGASGSPASGFVITFNGTWAAAPSCVGQMALAGMAEGKLPLVVATTTTTITITTNGAAPSTSDKYAFHCFGV